MDSKEFLTSVCETQAESQVCLDHLELYRSNHLEIGSSIVLIDFFVLFGLKAASARSEGMR